MQSKTLRLWVLPDCGLDTLRTAEGHLGAFQKGNPGLRVETTVRTVGSLWSGLMQILKRPERIEGGRPDIVEIPSHWTTTLAQMGLLEDLADLGSVDLSAWVPALREHAVEDKTTRVFSMPWWMEVWVLYYREDLLRRCRIDPERSLATWEGVRDACRAMSKKFGGARGIFPIANSNPRESIALADVASSVWAFGGDFFSKDGMRSLFHRDETVEGMRSYCEFLANGWMPLLGKSGLVPENLFDGRCALQLSGRYARRGLSSALLRRLRAVPCPGDSGGRAGVLAARHLAVIRGTESPREAFAAMQYLAGPAARRYADAIGAFACFPDWRLGVFDARPDLGEIFERAFSTARALPNMAVMASVERIFERNMEKLVRGILHGAYREAALREDLLYAKAEMDYVLAMHGGGQG